jgi:hypothetical protein
VTAADADYRRDAAGMLAEHAGWALNLGPAAAIYGVALLELDSTLKSPTFNSNLNSRILDSQ